MFNWFLKLFACFKDVLDSESSFKSFIILVAFAFASNRICLASFFAFSKISFSFCLWLDKSDSKEFLNNSTYLSSYQ